MEPQPPLFERWKSRLNEYFDDYYFGLERRRRAKLALVTSAVGLVCVIAVLIVLVSRDSGDSRDSATLAGSASTAVATTSLPPADGTISASVTDSSDVDGSVEHTSPPASPVDTTDDTVTVDTVESAPPVPTTTTDLGTTETSDPDLTGSGSVSTLPDGEVRPVEVLIDSDGITLTGAVTDEEAANRLTLLVLDYAGDLSLPVTKNLILDPAVPRGVGVRMLDLTTEPYPDQSSDLASGQQQRLDVLVERIVAFPRITIVVVGRTNLRDAAADFELADARADAVVSYMVGVGIAPDRFRTQVGGDDDWITDFDNEARLDLNRRLEVIVYGWLLS